MDNDDISEFADEFAGASMVDSGNYDPEDNDYADLGTPCDDGVDHAPVESIDVPLDEENGCHGHVGRTGENQY